MSVNDRMTAMSKEDLDAWEKAFGIKKEDKKSDDKKKESENEMWPNGVCWEDWL